MSSHKDQKREQLLDKIEALSAMGFKKPYHLEKVLGINDYETANKYLAIVARRLAHKYKHINREERLKDHLKHYDLAKQTIWDAINDGEDRGYNMGVLQKILKSEAELLGLEAPQQVEVKGQSIDLWAILQKLPKADADRIITEIDNATKQPQGDSVAK